MKRLLWTGLICSVLWLGVSTTAWAECKVLTTAPVYAAGQLKDITCGTGGAIAIGGAPGSATAAAPTYTEGGQGSASYDLSGNQRVTLGTLLAGEDQTNNLLMTSGGVARTTTFSSVTSATSSTVTTVPTGAKTFVAQIINATSETKAATLTIYGNLISSTTGGIAVCQLVLPSTATVVQLQDACPVSEVNFPFYFYTATVYTSASSAPLTVYAIY